MKKSILLGYIAFLLYGTAAFGQGGNIGHFSVGGEFLGWNGTGFSQPLQIRNNFNQPVNFFSNNFQRMLINNGFGGINDGQIAIGNNLTAGFTPQSRLHLHQTGGDNHIKFTNGTTGAGFANGFNIGVAGNGVAQFQQLFNSSFQFLFTGQTITTATMTILPPNAGGFLDLVRICPDNLPNRRPAKLIISDRNPTDPFALQQDNMLLLRGSGWGIDFGDPFAQTQGTSQSSPNRRTTLAFFEQSGTNRRDAGIRIQGARSSSPRCDISFIDFANYDQDEDNEYLMSRIASGNRQGVEENGFLRFYTRNNNNPLEERMRIDEFGRIGINTMNNAPVNPGNHGIPQNRLEITSGVGDPTPSGLRLTNLTSGAVPVLNPGLGVLSVDQNGDVIYVQDNPPTSGLGNLCSDPQNPLTGDYEIPLAGNNFYFSGQGSPNDRVGVGYNCSNPLPGKLSVSETNGVVSLFVQNTSAGTNNIGSNTQVLNSPNNFGCITTSGNPNGNTGFNVGHYAQVYPANRSYGVYGYVNAFAPATITTAFSYEAVKGVAVGNTAINLLQSFGGNFQNGINAQEGYGVFGSSNNATNNYGVFGRVTGSGSPSGTIGDYAGYFDGDVFITSGTYFPSETSLKQNIQSIQNALNALNRISSVSFNFNQANYPSVNLPAGLEYGVIAENLDTVLPDLVKNIVHPAIYDSTGAVVHPAVTFKGVNYTELIPWLIAGVNELNDSLQTQKAILQAKDSLITDLMNRVTVIETCLGNTGICNGHNGGGNGKGNNNRTTNIVTLQNATAIVLDQNNPNPFKETTFITYNIPDDVKSATMVFYDMNGRMIKEVNITERGESQLQVYGSDLSTGIYTYTLVVDGKVHASKKMVKN